MEVVARGEEEEVFETPDLAISEDEIALESFGGAKEGRKDNANKVPDAEVVSAFVPPQTAFEVFMGKTYVGAREDMSDAVGASSRTADGAVYTADGYRRETVDNTGGSGGGDGTHLADEDVPMGGAARDGKGWGGRSTSTIERNRTGESPVQRLVRLREETALLAEDLEEMSKSRRRGAAGEQANKAAGSEDTGDDIGGEGDGGADDGDAGGYLLWSAMAKETETLQRQLAQLSGDPRYKHIVSPTPRTAASEVALQQRLSEGVVQALERLRQAAAEDSTAAGAAGITGGESTAPADSVTFELFLKEAAEARRRLRSTGTGDTGLSGVEARIAALEKALGGTARVGGAGVDGSTEGEMVPLSQAVSTLEKRVSVLEPGRLEGLRQKAQLARVELDGLAKSRASSGASAGSTASGSGTVARQKKVDEAFATLQTWQGLAAGLPLLVDRLRSLETLHLASATFAQRLEQVEGSQAELVGVLSSTNEGLEATRTSAAENVAIAEENIRALDRRLSGAALS